MAQNNKLSIFISYASEQYSIAEQIYLTLSNAGHCVFFDRTTLSPGQDYNPSILSAIRSSDLMIFLISSFSIDPKSYSRTELQFAREVWPAPAGKILPVMTAPTEFNDIPNYLKAVTILQPQGNPVAEVASAVNDIANNILPGDTIAGQVNIIKNTAKYVQQQKLREELEEIDAGWEGQKQQYLIKVGEKLLEPTADHIWLTSLVSVVFSIIAYYLFSNDDGPSLTAGIIAITIGGCAVLSVLSKVKNFKKAKDNYLLRRSLVEDRMVL